MKKGTSMDELWRVAKGEVKYQDFLEKSQGKKQPRKQPDKPSIEVPDDLASSPSPPSVCKSSQSFSPVMIKSQSSSHLASHKLDYMLPLSINASTND